MVGVVASVELAERWLRILALAMPIIVGIVHLIRRPARPRGKARRVPIHFGALCLGALLLGTSGCVSSSVPAVINALAADTNSVTVSVRSPWGSVDVRRNAPER